MLYLRSAHNFTEIDLVKILFMEYAQSFNFENCFQNFDEELAGLPGEYAPPSGQLFLIYDDDTPIGCAALRKIDREICELKRLYLRPSSRGKGVGRWAVHEIIAIAKTLNYKKLVLDTMPSLKEALALYRSVGFRVMKPPKNDSIRGAIYLELELSDK
ncbi:GCN5-related N-acetyltransferase [Candidatus Zixiibacteriota bacterium]|nr:GCN5-related N-acetyltransferase [candidate division Zixibacteria bacterium]